MSGALEPGHEELLDLVAVYAVGALPPDEAERVRAHLEACPACRAEYALLRPVVDAVATAVETPVDADQLARAKSRFFAAVAPAAPSVVRARRFGLPNVPPSWLGLAALLVLGIAIAEAAIDAGLLSQLAGARGALAQRDRELAEVAAGTRFPVPGGEVVRSGATLYLVMPDMPEPPAGRVYQVWTLPRGSSGMRPGQTFVPSRGATVVPVPASGDAVAVAVSVEPAGGSAQPTTQPLFVRKLE